MAVVLSVQNYTLTVECQTVYWWWHQSTDTSKTDCHWLADTLV